MHANDVIGAIALIVVVTISSVIAYVGDKKKY